MSQRLLDCVPSPNGLGSGTRRSIRERSLEESMTRWAFSWKRSRIRHIAALAAPLLLTVPPGVIRAQALPTRGTGIIVGKVTDKTTGREVYGASVFVEG